MKFSGTSCKSVCEKNQINPNREVKSPLLEGIAHALILLDNFAKLIGAKSAIRCDRVTETGLTCRHFVDTRAWTSRPFPNSNVGKQMLSRAQSL